MSEKLIFFVRRAPGMPRDEFRRRYEGSHIEFVQRHFPRLRRYVVNMLDGEARTPEGTPDAFADIDAVAEMWFDSVDDFVDRARRYDSAESAVELERESAELFSAPVAYQVTEAVQRDYERAWPDGETSPGVKMVYPVRRKQDITREQFVAHWQGTHVPVVLRYMNGISRYVTNVVVRPIGPAPEIDGIVELHYLDASALQGPRYNAPEADAIMAEDVAQFLEPAGIAFRTRERILRS